MSSPASLIWRVKQELRTSLTDQEIHVEEKREEDVEEEDDEREQEKRTRLPVPFLICGQDDLSPAQTILSSFYKCRGFPQDCSFYSQDYDQFRNHLVTDHSADVVFQCFYCDRHKCGNSDQLLDHLITDHRLLRFQCNLCMYRTCRDIHLLNHHITCHYDQFEAGCNEDPLLAASSTTVIKSETFSAERVHPRDRDGGEVTGRCRMLVCPIPVAGPISTEDFDTWYFDTYKHDRTLSRDPKDNDKYQCCYCPVLDTDRQVAAHCSSQHPHFPLLMYLPKKEEEKPETDTPAATPQVKVDDPIPGPSSDRTVALIDPRRVKRTTSPPQLVNPVQAIPAAILPPHKPPERRRTTIEVIPDPVLVRRGTLAIEFPDPVEDESMRGNPSPDSGAGDPVNEDFGSGNEEPIDRGYITEDDLRRVQTDLEMSDDGEPDGVRRKKMRKRHRPEFIEGSDDEDGEVLEEAGVRKQLIERQRQAMRDRVDQHTESIQKVGHRDAKKMKCLLCQTLHLKVKIPMHLKKEHQTRQSIKCKDCVYMGSMMEIKQHIRMEHNGRGMIVKFVVNAEETEATVIETISLVVTNVRMANGDIRQQSIAPQPIVPVTRKRRASGPAPSFRTGKKDKVRGYLMREMREKTFIGPGKNERTAKHSASASDQAVSRSQSRDPD